MSSILNTKIYVTQTRGLTPCLQVQHAGEELKLIKARVMSVCAKPSPCQDSLSQNGHSIIKVSLM